MLVATPGSGSVLDTTLNSASSSWPIPRAPRPLFVSRQLGGRQSLEPVVRNRLTALDRAAVGPGGQPLLGSLDRGELLAEIVCEALVELVLIEIRCQVRRVILVRGLGVVLVPEPPESALDPLALGSQQLARPVSVHRRA